MDWGRAKAILIVAFLLLDVYLGYEYFLQHEQRISWGRWREAAEPGTVQKSLAEAGIVLLGPLPSPPPPMRRLLLRVASPDADDVARGFFGNRRELQESAWAGADTRVAGRTFRLGLERLTVLYDGLVLYERRDVAGGSVGQTMDAAAARTEAERFLRTHGGIPADADLDLVSPLGGGRPAFQVVYLQKYRNWRLFDAYIALEVVPGGVRAMQRVWLEPRGLAGPRQPVITAERALERLAAELRRTEHDRVLVERIDLGYYGGLQEPAAQWEAVPAWRIITRGGEQFYINGHTGELEKAG